jgi:hypothetical protein
MEIARLFPAFKPHEIGLLPFSYYAKLRDYYVEQRDEMRRALDRDGDSASWDSESVTGGPT